MSRTLAELDKFKVLHLDFENNFKDKSGLGNDGVPTDVEWKPTSRGMKPRFNGVSYVNCGDVSGFGAIDETVTLAAWIDNTKIGTASTNFGVIGTSGPNWMGFRLREDNYYSFQGFDTSNNYRYLYSNVFHLDYVGKWTHLVVTKDRLGVMSMYINGVLNNSTDWGAFNFQISGDMYISGGTYNFEGIIDDPRIYSTALDADEVLAIYNATKQGHGVLRHESSFTHRLSPQVNASTVFATDMHTRNGSQLADLSGNGNHGTIAGAVRSGGYFSDGMRFANGNRVEIDNIGYDVGSFELSYLFKSSASVDIDMYSQVNTDNVNNRVISNYASGKLLFEIDDAIIASKVESYVNLRDGKLHTITCVRDWDKKELRLYADGALLNSAVDNCVEDIGTNGKSYLGYFTADVFDGEMSLFSIRDLIPSESTIKSRFNSLATLPLYHIDFSRYPSNTTVYSGNIPYSSMRVESGSFKVDGSQLVCVTDGSLTMRNAHAFDGSEYISITADGVKTSDTGSVTAGTTTASITQGSSLITVAMSAGDVLAGLLVTFRKEVE